jgi:hypothetical protein
MREGRSCRGPGRGRHLARGTAAFVGFLLFPGLSMALQEPSATAAGTVRFPTEVDALAFAPSSESILYGPLGVETRLPGPVADREEVSIGLSTNGQIASVAVVQRLTITGTGDFSFKVPGPARDVQALPESGAIPGLRKGALLWQGFAAGTKILAARVELFPDQEAKRLPISLTLRMSVDERPISAGLPASGAFRLILEIKNSSAVPIRVADADADPARLAPVLDTLRGLLTSGRRIRPGQDGIPDAVETTGTVTSRQEPVEVPFEVRGEVLFPPGSLSEATVEGATARSDAKGTHVEFQIQVGGGAPQEATVDVRGQANRLGLPGFQMTGGPASPLARQLRPPFGRSWSGALARAPERLDGRRMLGLAMDVLWRAARLRQFDAYLGNPDVNGTSTSRYSFRLAPAVRPPGRPVDPPAGAAPAAIAAALVLLVVLGTALALAWAHS